MLNLTMISMNIDIKMNKKVITMLLMVLIH